MNGRGLLLNLLFKVRKKYLNLPLLRVNPIFVQEALNNIAKHSNADLIYLSLKRTGGKIELAVDDNGVGFDIEQTLSGDQLRKGLGLSSMKERVSLSGGIFEIKSSEGAGTTVRALWEY